MLTKRRLASNGARPGVPAGLGGRVGLLLRVDEWDYLPPQCARRYRAAVEEVVRLYDAWSEGVPVHRIHGDCHVGNLLEGDQGWFFLDFDDFVLGPAVQDVWMLLPGRDAEGARQRALLLEAYQQFRDFDPRWRRLVEPLRAFRFVFCASWSARRWQHPAFPDAFLHFGTPQYWESETRDLEEHVEKLLRDGGEVPALTNKDLFWDL